MTRLLIIKPSSLGDIIHGLQVAATLQVHQPDLRIDWVAGDAFAPLVRRARGIERVHVFERRGGWSGWRRLWRELRAETYDRVFDFQGLLRSGLMTFAAKSAQKIGRSDAREGAGFAYHRRVPLPPGGRESHAVDILLQFCGEWGWPAELRGRVAFRPSASPAANRPPARSLVLFPESRRPEKCWPYFEPLTERLLHDLPGARVTWAGSERREPSAAWAEERFCNLTGRTPLEALPEVIGEAALVIANDSGPAHLAAAMGVPVLALFGPTEPRCHGPYPASEDARAWCRVLRAPDGELGRLRAAAVVGEAATLVGLGRAGGA